MSGHAKWSEIRHKPTTSERLEAARRELRDELARYPRAWRSSLLLPICRLFGHREDSHVYVSGDLDEFLRPPEFYGECIACSRCGRLVRRVLYEFDPADIWAATRRRS